MNFKGNGIAIRPVHDSAGNEHRSRQGGSQRRS